MVGSDAFPRLGEQVLIPWGLEEVRGEVVEVYATGLGDRAVVRLLDDNGSDATVTVPADSLIPLSGPSRGMSPRIDAMTFANQVRQYLQRAVSALQLEIDDHPLPDRGVDAVITGGSREIVVQIKYYGTTRLSSDAISALAGYATAIGRPTVVVADAGLTEAAEERLRHLNNRARITWFVRWTGADAYPRLADVIREATGLPRQRIN